MSKLNKNILFLFKNKYFLTLIVFFIWLLIFDQNNLIDRANNIHKQSQLEKEKKNYLQKIEQDEKRMNELKTDKKNLEKFAREQYLMKKDNEDIFVIVDENKKK
ncbi:MAG: septum formation initiator family protein [Bacteroidetes bacterium]|nr:septum formation initiator family protein [Bacteroidota bacterium]